MLESAAYESDPYGRDGTDDGSFAKLGDVNAGADELGLAGVNNNGTAGPVGADGDAEELDSLEPSVAVAEGTGELMSDGLITNGALLANFGTDIAGTDSIGADSVFAFDDAGCVAIDGGAGGTSFNARLPRAGSSGVVAVLLAVDDSEGFDLPDELRTASTNNIAINPNMVALYSRFVFDLPPTGLGTLLVDSVAVDAIGPLAKLDLAAAAFASLLVTASGTAAADTIDGWTFCNANNTGTAEVP